LDAVIKHIQWVIGSILYYARAVDLTVLMALSTIASEQAQAPRTQFKKTKNSSIIWPLTGHKRTVSPVGYDIEHSLQYILFIQGKCTQPSMRTLLHGMESQSHTANQIEWNIFHLVASAAEAELGAFFLNCKQATIFDSPLKKCATHNC
jgi:hypothetical protein